MNLDQFAFALGCLAKMDEDEIKARAPKYYEHLTELRAQRYDDSIESFIIVMSHAVLVVAGDRKELVSELNALLPERWRSKG